MIVGSHPHVLQGHEWINETLVHYSLGNFVFHPHFTMMVVSKMDIKSITGRYIKNMDPSVGMKAKLYLKRKFVVFPKTSHFS